MTTVPLQSSQRTYELGRPGYGNYQNERGRQRERNVVLLGGYRLAASIIEERLSSMDGIF